MWQFEWLTAWEDVWSPDFLARWQKLLASSPAAHVFFSPPLVRAWVQSYAAVQPVAPRFLLARQETGAEIFLPLVELRGTWQDAWRRLLVPVGHLEFDYHDPIANQPMSASAWQTFWQQFRQEIRQFSGFGRAQIVMSGVRSHSLAPGLARIPVNLAPFVDLSGIAAADALLPALPSRLRGDIRRQWRRLEKLGPCTFHIYTADETDRALQILPGLLDAHRRKWPLAHKAPGFHEQLVRHALPGGKLHLSAISVDGKPISWHMGFCDTGRFYWYMPAYDPAYSAYSPGKLHLFFCMQDAVARGCTVFDLLKGNEAYKHAWTQHANVIYDLDWNLRAIFSHAQLARDKKRFGIGSLEREDGCVALSSA